MKLSQFQCVKAVVILAMLTGLLMSPKLWRNDRHFPTAPVSDRLPVLLNAELWPYGMLIALLAVSFVFRRALLLFVPLLSVWCLWDQTRVQPWVYQYSIMLLALGLGKPVNRDTALQCCRFILAGTYFWSGLQKYNFRFANEIFPWVSEPLQKLLTPEQQAWLLQQGWHAALVESLLGLLLLMPRIRNLAAVAVILMHGALLYCLGPWGRDWNEIVWPWNLAMMLLVGLLFINVRIPQFWPRRSAMAVIVLFLFGILPLFNFFGYWDSYLSAALYSGTSVQARIVVSEKVQEKLPTETREKHIVWDEVQLQSWAMAELNVPPNPEPRIYRSIARKLARLDDTPGSVQLILEGRPAWRTGVRTEQQVSLE